jgi:hypothetical protein
MSGSQNVRQLARRRVVEARMVQARERVAREKRLTDHAVAVLSAIAERDVAVARAEEAASAAIHKMIGEGLTPAQVADWCGGELNAREVLRLSKLPARTGEG